MDKQLDDLKIRFEEVIPTAFTDHDKQGIWAKISEGKQKRRTNPIFPKIISAIVVSALIFIGMVMVNEQLHVVEFGSRNGGDSPDKMYAVDESNDHETQVETEITQFYTTFDPETIQPGDLFGNMKVIEVQRQDEKTIITFDGYLTLFGDIVNEDRLVFLPNETSEFDFPFAIDDAGLVALSFQNDEIIKTMYGLDDWEGKDYQTMEDVVVDTVTIEYIYSPKGSTINLSVDESLDMEYPTETYETTIELSDELLEVYEQYSGSYDDTLLKGLKPIDVFKLHFHADNMGDEEVVYELLIQDEMYGTPDKETYFNDSFFANSETMKENDRKFYQELKKVQIFNEKYLSDEEAMIEFMLEETSGYGFSFFRLIKDTELDVWKVGWMAMQ